MMLGVEGEYLLVTVLVQLATALVLLNAALRPGAAANRWLLVAAAFGFVVSGVGPAGYVLAQAPQLVGTAYGLLIAVKVAAALLPALAWLRRRHPAGADRLWAGMTVTAVAVAVLLNVASPVVSGQPVWPFAWTLSLDPVRSDVVVRMELLRSLPWLAAAMLCWLLAICFWRRLRHRRWLPIALATCVIWQQAPDVSWLIVPASPTAYYHSPNRFTALSILRGEDVYVDHCVACHGAAGHGDGVLASFSPRAPADLTAGHLWMHSDGELFWWLTHGIGTSAGSRSMPGFAGVLSSQQIWDVIDYLRARNAGSTRQRTGRWSPTILAPDAVITCADRQGTTLAELRGHPVRIVLGGEPVNQAGIVTVFINEAPSILPMAGNCVAGADVGRAYALAAGLPAWDTQGTQFLIDAAGWLRAMQKPPLNTGWNDPQQLAAALWQLTAAPISGDTSICHAQD